MVAVIIITMMVTYTIPAMTVYAADPANGSTKDFKVNLFNYDQQTVNTQVRTLRNNDTDLFGFHGQGGGALELSGQQSRWTGTDGGVYPGLVKSNLTAGGSLEYQNPIRGIDLFDVNSSYYTGYGNVDFPFTYQNGKYVYDSMIQSASLDGGRIVLGTHAANASNKAKGFWPFNSSPAAYDYHFGMTMEVDFYVPASRSINGSDMVFNFSGDDDVWVFVDGKLVLDLGGIHDAYGGSINFTTGTITNAKLYSGIGTDPRNNHLSSIFGNDWNTNELAGNTVHKLKIFYLERGAGLSNCKIEFNIPKYEHLSVEKAIGNLNEGITFSPSTEFEFRILTIKPGQSDYTPYEGNYDLTNDGAPVSGTHGSDANGSFNLKAGEKATFTDILIDTPFKIEEVSKADISSEFDAESWMKADENARITINENVVTGILTVGEESDNFALICTNNRKTTDIELEKIGADTNRALAGAVFRLAGTSGFDDEAVSVTATSGADGRVLFENIPIGEYAIEEIAAPTGYERSETTYQAIVSAAEEALVVTFKDAKGMDIDFGDKGIPVVENKPVLGELTIIKVVKGGNAPEYQGNQPEEPVPYNFEIYFDGDWLDEEAFSGITGSGVEVVESLQEIETDDNPFNAFGGDTASYSFSLAKDEHITIPVREGGGFRLSEETGNYITTYSWKGVDAEVVTVSEEALDGILGDGSVDNVITVQNHYGNDGLTVQKSVAGTAAPNADTLYEFSAIFWVEGDQEEMDGQVIRELEGPKNAAKEALAALELAEEELAAIDSLETAKENLQAKADLAAEAEEALGETREAHNAASERALELPGEIAAKEAEIGLKEEAFAAAEDNETREAIQAEIDGLNEELTDLQNELAGLDLDGLQATLDAKEAAYNAAEAEKLLAEEALADAEEDLADMNLGDKVTDYLASKEALERAEAALAEYNNKSQTEKYNDHFLEGIWNRIAGFFRVLLIGVQGEDVENVITDRVRYEADNDAEIGNEGYLLTFWLKDGEEVVFNFEEILGEDVDTVYFNIVETDAQGATSVQMNVFGLEGTRTSEAAILGTVTVDALEKANPIITFNNDFTPKKTDPEGPGNPNPPGPGGPSNPGTPSTPPEVTIPEEEIPAGPAPEVDEIVLEEEGIPAGNLPQTGGTPALLLYGVGILLAGGGIMLRRKEKQ